MIKTERLWRGSFTVNSTRKAYPNQWMTQLTNLKLWPIYNDDIITYLMRHLRSKIGSREPMVLTWATLDVL